MTNQKIIVFFNQMRYRAGTHELAGLRSLSINTLHFKFDPAVDDDDAYGLFDYMYGLCGKVCGKATVGVAVNAAAYLVDNKIPFTIGFRWDRALTLRSNLAYLFHTRRFRRMLRDMKADMESDPSVRWVPYCEKALFETDRRLKLEGGSL